MKPFTDGHALTYLQSPRADKNGRKVFPTETRDHFLALLMACGRWGHVFVTSVNPMSPSSKFTARGGEYDIKMGRLCKRYLWGGFPSARINHDTETREIEPALPWGLKQLEIIHTSSTSRDASPYRPHVVPLPFPLLGLRLKVVPLLSPTGIYNTRKVRSVRYACDEFDQKN